ncbi:MAG TPA: hypothetical protein VL984_09545, partial [Acidimicrobiales bacterium]|nr:hypothetical protein [Acidimicrobiales bacterium]
ANPPSPDQPIVLWGTKNNSGTGATFYDFAGCGTTNGRILSDHTITENNAQQLSEYAADNPSGTIYLNTTGCPSNGTDAAGESCGADGTTGASSTTFPGGTATTDDCGGNGTSSTGLGTSSYTTTNEACVDQEVADSIFFMSYGYYASHPFTASVTIPTSAVGSSPGYLDQGFVTSGTAFNYEVVGTATTIAKDTVSGPYLGLPGTGGVAGDPRATNAIAVQTGRDLWMDYLNDHVRASAAALINWVCDYDDYVAPKALDQTTGLPYDQEITNDITAWGWGRLSCDGGSGAFGVSGSTYTAPITGTAGSGNGAPIIDPGPPNNE